MAKHFRRWLFWLFLVSALSACLLPNFRRARTQGSLTWCPSNCKNIATALRMYASDNGGRYPAVLSRLTAGNYLKLIPTCPAARADTYSLSYRTTHSSARFRFVCAGNNHAKAFAGFSTSSKTFPQCSSEFGLVEHP